jgi:hypothetical protein
MTKFSNAGVLGFEVHRGVDQQGCVLFGEEIEMGWGRRKVEQGSENPTCERAFEQRISAAGYSEIVWCKPSSCFELDSQQPTSPIQHRNKVVTRGRLEH